MGDQGVSQSDPGPGAADRDRGFPAYVPTLRSSSLAGAGRTDQHCAALGGPQQLGHDLDLSFLDPRRRGIDGEGRLTW